MNNDLILQARISLLNARKIFYKVNSIEVKSSWKNLTDTATIVLPKNIKEFKDGVKSVFKEGDPIYIEFGYGRNLYTEFEGYISKISEAIPVKIYCEDAMYWLKRETVSFTKQQCRLGQLLKAIVPKPFTLDYLDMPLGNVRYSEMTVAQILEKLKNDYGTSFYFVGNTLYANKIYTDQSNVPVQDIKLESYAVGENLENKNGEQRQIRVKVISMLKNGKKIQKIVGDKTGKMSTLKFNGIEVEAELETLGNKFYNSLKKKGFDGGNMELFGIPHIVHGQKINLISEMYRDRNGIYYVDSVEKTFSESGIRQKIELGSIAS